MSAEIYQWADSSMNACPRYETGFTQLLAPRPFLVAEDVRLAYDSRLSVLRSFQNTALSVLRSAICGDSDSSVLHWLLNETPASLGLEYHRKLDDRHFTLPVFCRTDEVRPGRIAEVQCPGSLWGELQLTFELASQLGYSTGAMAPSVGFVSQLSDLLEEPPIVHHLLDNSSTPWGVRYFIEKTRPGVKFWGIDRDIRVGMCNFIRSHSFFGLCAENEFCSRLQKTGNGVTYDLPPHVLFDQKASLVLPFWSVTRRAFSDDIREAFLFSTPLLPTGVELPDGSHYSIEEFSQRPRSQRAFYLKYAGSSVALNWGSKAVYRLSNMSSESCLQLLNECIGQYDVGQIWLLQKEETQDDEIDYLTRDGILHTEKMRAKFSGFYGPGGCLGVLGMHRHHNKVHGQADTVVSYVLGDSGGPYPLPSQALA